MLVYRAAVRAAAVAAASAASDAAACAAPAVAAAAGAAAAEPAAAVTAAARPTATVAAANASTGAAAAVRCRGGWILRDGRRCTGRIDVLRPGARRTLLPLPSDQLLCGLCRKLLPGRDGEHLLRGTDARRRHERPRESVYDWIRRRLQL